MKLRLSKQPSRSAALGMQPGIRLRGAEVAATSPRGRIPMIPNVRVVSGRKDSNLRPLDPQSSALTRLRYAPKAQEKSATSGCLSRTTRGPQPQSGDGDDWRGCFGDRDSVR